MGAWAVLGFGVRAYSFFGAYKLIGLMGFASSGLLRSRLVGSTRLLRFRVEASRA